jgi:hypothetical protein
MRSSGVIQQESNTLPSRLELQRLGATKPRSKRSVLYTGRRLLGVGLAAVLAEGLIGPAAATEACRALQAEWDQLSRQAMKAEIALLHDLRQRLCPEQEGLATGAHALAPDQASFAQIDYEAYIRCRQQAEAQLQRSRPALYRNQRSLPFYTAEGARLARQADAVQGQRDRQCPAPGR